MTAQRSDRRRDGAERAHKRLASRASSRSGGRGAGAPYVAAAIALMMAFLGWLLFEWVSYLRGAVALVCIFAVVVLGALASVASLARHRH